MNFFDQGIPLGRWFRIPVILHWSFVLYAAFRVFPNGQYSPEYMRWFVLLFLTVLLHEFGHALSCRMVGGEATKIILWPLGGLAFVKPPDKAWAHLVTTVCGPLVNVILWLGFLAIEKWVLPAMLQRMDPNSLFLHEAIYVILFMIEINYFLLLFNLIPAYPMDGGRILQEVLWMTIGYRASLQISGMIGVACGAGFVVIGLGLQGIKLPVIDLELKGPNIMLVVIGAMCILESFVIYARSNQIQEWRKK